MKCDFCDEDISYLALARVLVKIAQYNFCADVCAEQWLDSFHDKPGVHVKVALDTNEREA